MKWVDKLEEYYPEMVRCDEDIRDLVAAVRIMEATLDEIARISYCNGIEHKATCDAALLALTRVNEIRTES